MDSVLFGSILSASLLGSLHCAGMCGGIVGFYAAQAPGRQTSLHLGYNLGRLSIYLTLGALAGLFGSGLNLAGKLVTIHNLAGIAAAFWMILWGLLSLARQFSGVSTPHLGMQALSKRMAPLYRTLFSRADVPYAFLLGTLSGLLPCGWLYLFVGGAAGSGSPLAGALMMGVFWLGTLPALASIGLLARRTIGPFQRILPTVAALVLVVGGLWSVYAKLHGMDSLPAAFVQGEVGNLNPSTHLCGTNSP